MQSLDALFFSAFSVTCDIFWPFPPFWPLSVLIRDGLFFFERLFGRGEPSFSLTDENRLIPIEDEWRQ